MALLDTFPVTDFRTVTDNIIVNGGCILFNRDGGIGHELVDILTRLKPSMYPTISDEEINDGVLEYVFGRVPEEYLTAEEILFCSRREVPDSCQDLSQPTRRRSCYMLGEKQIVFTTCGGRTDFYDLMAMLTVLHIEAGKKGESKYKRHLDNYRRVKEITVTEGYREELDASPTAYKWAKYIKKQIRELGLINRPIHLISANLFSVLYCMSPYPRGVQGLPQPENIGNFYVELRKHLGADDNRRIFYEENKSAGIYQLAHQHGTGVGVQIFDLPRIDFKLTDPHIEINARIEKERPVLLVMDYGFGHQAFFLMDGLIKALGRSLTSISVMGKAGIFQGNRGDILIPEYCIVEGTPYTVNFDNSMSRTYFDPFDRQVHSGSMATIIGTLLQNRKTLEYLATRWNAIGCEMELAYYASALNRNMIRGEGITAPFYVAYYASDNPLIDDQTLTKGGLGEEGVIPVYATTLAILNSALSQYR